jgi:hypothetical protein
MKIIKVAYWVKNSFGTNETTGFVTELVYGSLNPYLNFTILEVRELSDICADIKESKYGASCILENPKKHIKTTGGQKCFNITSFHPRFTLNEDHCISASQMVKRCAEMDAWVKRQPKWEIGNSYQSLFKKIL